MRYVKILALLALAGCASTEDYSGKGVNWNRVSNVAVGTAVVVTLGALAAM